MIRAVLGGRRGDAPPCSSVRATRDDGAPNPVLVRRAAWALAAGLSGDRGLGPLLARPTRSSSLEVAVEGANPDVDTPEDLAALQPAEAAR